MLTIDSVHRSVIKAITYRVCIMILDVVTIYLFTGALHIAIGFMLVSNLYTTIGYLVHERIWARIRWGLNENR
ncbi:MAG: DUF2061 domain-containing protein [Burkholderiaceae bacterium]|nr:DUF2061 domain-containing protein [Burkholderiaceae bacterium]